MGAETINKGKDYIKLYSVAGHNAPRIDVNTDLVKHEVYKFIGKGKFEDGSVPKGFCYFPIEYGWKHFRQLTAEDRVKKQISGVVKYKWDNQGRRNE